MCLVYRGCAARMVSSVSSFHLSHVMGNPVYAICEQQRRRWACASAQSNQRLCCSLPGLYNTSTCYSRNVKTLASLSCWTGRFESFLVANPEDRLSRDEAHICIAAYSLRVWYMNSFLFRDWSISLALKLMCFIILKHIIIGVFKPAFIGINSSATDEDTQDTS